MSTNHQQYRTAESVSPRHPDKLCDRVSDAVLDAYLARDPEARVAVDVAGGHGRLFITGEVTSQATVDVLKVARRIVGDIEIIESIATQSPEIARGVNVGGAGDQGIMIGYACSETPELMPLEQALARSLNQFLYKAWPYDGKTQVSVRGRRIESIVASFQNAPKAELTSAVETWLAEQHYAPEQLAENIDLFINPAGDWSQGGFDADAGLTGRKLAVDSYGPRIPIGGGAFSGKDATKVDRSAAYMARQVAVDYLQQQEAQEVFVRLAYAIGVAEPLEATVVVDGVPSQIEGYDLTPQGIINALQLKQPQFERTAEYGHFGQGFSWDKIDD